MRRISDKSENEDAMVLVDLLLNLGIVEVKRRITQGSQSEEDVERQSDQAMDAFMSAVLLCAEAGNLPDIEEMLAEKRPHFLFKMPLPDGKTLQL